ncbi:diadenylate cyclase [Paenibacillus chitinolyticus]|uniref:diadenylate cyclase n=1 Tax=Paenibacillus chitinolyticus TaxID=79263 RepID=UPI003CFEE130
MGYTCSRNACAKNHLAAKKFLKESRFIRRFVGKKTGTRHRAALGLLRRRDALVLVVPVRTGRFSAAINGHPSPLRPAK